MQNLGPSKIGEWRLACVRRGKLNGRRDYYRPETAGVQVEELSSRHARVAAPAGNMSNEPDVQANLLDA